MSLQLSSYTVPAIAFSPPATESLACIMIASTGDVKKYINGVGSDIGDWLNPKSGMSGYEAMATLISGTIYAGALGSWISCDLNPNWTARDTVKNGVAVTASITVQIREKANHANIVSATQNLSANLSG